MAYLWRIPEDYPEGLIAEYQRIGSPDRFVFMMGEPLSLPVGAPAFKIRADLESLSRYACIPNSSQVPLVNDRLAQFLEAHAADDIEFVRARVLASNGESSAFSLMNAKRKAACIDHERSVYSSIPGTRDILSFRKLQHLDGCLAPHAIAREAEYLTHLLVSSDLAAALNAEEFGGIALERPEQIVW